MNNILYYWCPEWYTLEHKNTASLLQCNSLLVYYKIESIISIPGDVMNVTSPVLLLENQSEKGGTKLWQQK